MANFEIDNIRIAAIATSVPSNIEENKDLDIFEEGEADKIIASTGIKRRRVADTQTKTADLCLAAAEKIISKLEWSKEDIECLIFVSQTPDYKLPATSCILQGKLGLSTECYTVDISYGCSGWVYGLSVISSLISTTKMKKGLLLVGETTTKYKSPQDKTAWPLFGDAGTATAIEFSLNAEKMYFNVGTDGVGYKSIIIRDGGARNPYSEKSLDLCEIGKGIYRRALDSEMDGFAVFSFGLKRAPKSLQSVLEYSKQTKEEIDYFIFHQANLYMNEKIRKKLDIPLEKVPYSLEDYGNTSSATIPLTICSRCSSDDFKEKRRLLATAFGVGLSWGSVIFSLEKIVLLPIIEYNNEL